MLNRHSRNSTPEQFLRRLRSQSPPCECRCAKSDLGLTPANQFANILDSRVLHSRGPARLRIGFRVSILASGSSGNCTLLETERTCLLVDAGINRKELGRRLECLGIKPGHLDGILISHEHTDHTNGLAQISHEWSATAYLTKSTHQEIKKYLPEPAAKKLSRVEHIRAGDVFMIGDIEVSAFAIPEAITAILIIVALLCWIDMAATLPQSSSFGDCDLNPRHANAAAQNPI